MNTNDISPNWVLTFDGSYMKLSAAKGFASLTETAPCACCGNEAHSKPQVDPTADTGFQITGYIREADARLMAAAPALLEALEYYLPMLEDQRQDSVARAAIDKARGEA